MARAVIEIYMYSSDAFKLFTVAKKYLDLGHTIFTYVYGKSKTTERRTIAIVDGATMTTVQHFRDHG